MTIISDLHIHSKYSRATSKNLNISNLEKYAKIKGVNLLGTGDFMHPSWLRELKENLKERDGVFYTKSEFPFILSNEISLMYSQDNRGRRVHLVLLAPSFEVVDQMVDYFTKFGRVDYDGRPIFGKSCVEVAESLKNISKDIEIIPAHVWTPWFGLLGSKSGFDSVEEAFKDQTKNIFALETGLSSDPAMNWRLSKLDKFTLVSFSDLHSFWPWRLGREATLFDFKNITYANLIKAIRTKEGYSGTLEISPSEGKYHYTGHRACNVCLSPKEALKLKNICPVCGRPLTVGVLQRVEELADRPDGFRPKNAFQYRSLIPLSEVIAGVLKTGVATQKTWIEYNKLISRFGSEMNIILEASEKDLKQTVSEKLAEMIIKDRNEQIPISAGFDGEYGKPIFDKNKVKIASKPKVLQRQADLDQFT